VNPTEGTQVGAERRACPFTGIAVDLPSAVPVIISGPFVDAVADRGMGRVTPPVALPLVGIQPCAASREVFHDELMTRPSVGAVTHPEPLLACLTRDETDNGRTIIGIGAVPLALIRAPAGRIRGVAMGGTFFPPRSDTVHLPQRRRRSSPRSGR
jgi:hypothetical protein